MIPNRLRLLRAERSLTQRNVARGADIAERQYQTYESGARAPSCETLIALANFFNVSIDFLVGRTDKQEVNR